MILVGTREGLLSPGGRTHLEGRSITSVALDHATLWILADQVELLRGDGASFEPVARVEGDPGNCVLSTSNGVFVGTARARLLRLDGEALEQVAPFDAIEGRADWYTPWGGPPDTRSMAEAPGGTLFVNVHVGGILRSTDGGATWVQTIDIDTDIHQVIVTTDGTVCATGAAALHVSTDAGATWDERTEGLHATYLRAACGTDEGILVSASRNHTGADAALYRAPLKGGTFERVDLPDDLTRRNIDTHWLAAAGNDAAFVTAEGDLYRSEDAGWNWERIATSLPTPTCLAIGD